MVGVRFKENNDDAKVFYYQKNLQGDVVAIYDTAGAVQAKYSYDAFGNCTITDSTNSTIANANPIRYRGYYYDTETSWYFLNSRYYSPEWRRFISPDDIAFLDSESVNGLHLYCYCNNDPVNYADPSGHKLEWLGWLIGGALIVASIAITIASLGTLSGVAIGALAVTGAITGGVAGALNAASTGGNIAQGVITGALVGIAGAFSPLAGGLMATGMSLINDRINNENFNLNSITKAIISGVTAYTFSYGSAELANLMLANGGDALLTWTAYGVSNFIFASHNFATDTILYHVLN